MATEVRMPQLGESVHEGTVGRWLKQVGDSVAKYEPLLEVITDKVDTEVTASEAGTVLRIVAAEGDVVKVGAVLAIIGAAGEATADAASQAASAAGPGEATAGADAAASAPAGTVPTPTPSAATDPSAPARVSPVAARMAADHGIDPATLSGTGPGGQVRREDVERAVAGAAAATASGAASSADAPATTAFAATTPSAPVAPLDLSRNIGFISPRVARAAAEQGVDLRYVAGTGQDGRITARDVERFVAAGGLAAAMAASAAAMPAPAPIVAPAPAAPTLPTESTMPPAPTPATAAGAPATSPAPAAAPASTNPADFIGEIMPLTRMRRLIADHMVKSIQTSPHVATIHEVDMSAAMAAYKAQKDAVAARGGRLTITAIIVDCVAKALVKHPLVNSAWTDEGVRIHRDVNIGMAVAIPNGLIVPVIKQASTKSLVGLAADIDDLAKRARDGALKPDDIQGGTFTITNYGTLGSLFGTPVINQPQCAILGTGAIKKRVVVVETKHGDQIAIRPMMYLALTFDHRILDGGTADPFMRTITELLEGYSA